MTTEDIVYKRLKWRSRRGMAELDLLLMPFVEQVYRDLEPVDQRSYEKLLDQDDPDLLAWFHRQGVPEDPDLARVVQIILDWRPSS
jgi:antitoxin CptB